MPNFAVLTELNTLGKMDKFLYDSPELTFFRYQHMKTTNFAVDQILTPMSGNNNTRFAEIEREGDLALNCYMVVDVPGMDADTAKDNAGLAMIDNVQLTIGNQCVERLSGAYMMAWDELSGGRKQLTKLSNSENKLIAAEDAGQAHRLYVPLPFTFTKNSGAALPLIGLQFHAVKITVNLRNVTDIYPDSPKIIMDAYQSSKGKTADAADAADGDAVSSWNDFQFHLLTNQVYLDKEERNAFADYSNDVLIEQVQERKLSKHNLNRPFQLTYNHSISELIWAIANDECKFELDLGNKPDTDAGEDENTDDPTGPAITAEGISEVSLKLNNHERFHALGKHGDYFRKVQPYEHHTNVRSSKIYCYNFGLKPEDAQPSGSINMSRIDNVMMTLHSDIPDGNQSDYDYYLWARNYNVLRIQNGMGGLVLTS